jgi:DNA polymerase III epsilon subunit-like protein
VAIQEFLSGQWFNANGELWSFRNAKQQPHRQPSYTSIHVAPEDRSSNTKDWAKNGLTYADCEHAPRFAEVHAKIVEFVEKHPAPIKVMMAHNGEAYDFSIWRKALEKINQNMPANWVLFDSMPFFRFMIQSSGQKNEKPGLDYLCDLFKVEVDKRHQAYDDTKATGDVLRKCLAERSQDIIGYLTEWLESVNLIHKSSLKFKLGSKTLTLTRTKEKIIEEIK